MSLQASLYVPATVLSRPKTTTAVREDALRSSHHNVSLIGSDLVDVDLETDGGASLLSTGQMEAMVSAMSGVSAPNFGPELEGEFARLLGFKHIVTCAHGRAAESLWCQVAAKVGSIVLGNMLFPSAVFHHFQNLCRVFECSSREAYDLTSESPFKGNLDLDRMKSTLNEHVGRVAYVWAEPCCNAAGGHPISMANIREVSQFARKNGIPLVINATRIFENAYLIQQRESEHRGRAILDLVREFVGYADACVMSAAKDLFVTHGAVIATNDREIFEQLSSLCSLKGVHLSAMGQAMLAHGLREMVANPGWMSFRCAQVEYLHARLRDQGVPVLNPHGGHAVYLDSTQFAPHIPVAQHPSEAIVAHLYRLSGVRARAGYLTQIQDAFGVRLVRLAVPARRYGREDLDYAADAVIQAYERRAEIAGLRVTSALPGLAFMQGHSTRYAPAAHGEWSSFNWAQIWWQRARFLAKRTLLLAEDAQGRFTPVTWGQLGDEARYAAQGLASWGIKRSDRVAFLCENRTEWLAMDGACLALGATSVPIYPQMPASRAALLVRSSEATVAFVSGRHQLDKLLGADLPDLRQIVICDDSGGVSDSRLHPWSELLAVGRANPVSDGEWDLRLAETPLDAPASIMYTSGTSGVPSGVVITQGNLVAAQLAARWPFFEDKGYTYLGLLDLNHLLGRNAFYSAVYSGYITVVLPRKVDVEFDPGLFELFPPVVMVVVPRVVEKIVRYLLRDENIAASLAIIEHFERNGAPREQLGMYQGARRKLAVLTRFKLGNRIMFFAHGGAPLPPKLRRFFQLAGIALTEGYGMTECGMVAANTVYDLKREGAVGRPHHYVQTRIAAQGEIQIKGQVVSPGYLEEARNRESFVDGWFRTGDCGEIDVDGFLKVTGRMKDTYNLSDGSNVHPTWIEGLLIAQPLIQQAVVIGDVKPFVIALAVPDFSALRSHMAGLGMEVAGSDEKLAADERVRALFENCIRQVNEAHLGPAEQIRRFALLAVPFPDACLTVNVARTKVTVNRPAIYKTYVHDIEHLYAENES